MFIENEIIFRLLKLEGSCPRKLLEQLKVEVDQLEVGTANNDLRSTGTGTGECRPHQWQSIINFASTYVDGLLLPQQGCKDLNLRDYYNFKNN